MDNEELDEIVNDDMKNQSSNLQENPKIIPSYMKKENNEEKIKSNKLKKSKKVENIKPKDKKNRRKSIITKIIIVLISLAIIIGILFFIKLLTKPDYEKYRPYEEKMHIYGFDAMYDNQTALTEEGVTKSEAIKLITSTMLNTTDILNMSIASQKDYTNADYVDYAVTAGIINDQDINEDNANDIIKYQDLITYIESAKKIILKEEAKTDVEVKAKNYKNISSDMQIIVSDLVSNGIVENSTAKISLNKKVFKGMLNEMLINIAEKFNTITIGDSKLNINPDKVPNNAEQYTYILSNVDKKVYEYDFIKSIFEDEFLNPRETYLKKRDVYTSIQYRVEEYYNLILNIDYNTINYDEFYEKLCSYLVMMPNKDKIKEYVDYVKDNQIKISGSGKVQMPIVYFDGENYRVRTKVVLEIENSYVRNNILVFDAYDDYIFEYTENKYEIIIDTPMTTAYGFNSIYVRPEEFITSIVSDNKSIKQVIDESLPTTIVELEELNKELEKLQKQQ